MENVHFRFPSVAHKRGVLKLSNAFFIVLGYNPVITIPAGATKINVTEIRRSKNFLGEFLFVCVFLARKFAQSYIINGFFAFSALKSHESTKYYINGNRVIDLPKGYTVAGTTFYYSRPRRINDKKESLIADGPTTEDLDVMVRNHFSRSTIYCMSLNPPNSKQIDATRGLSVENAPTHNPLLV